VVSSSNGRALYERICGLLETAVVSNVEVAGSNLASPPLKEKECHEGQ